MGGTHRIASVNDHGLAFGFQARKALLHLLNSFRRVSLPLCYLADDAQRITGSVGQGRIAGKFLVRHIGVVDDRAGGFHHIDALRRAADGKFSSPNGSIQGGSEENVFSFFMLFLLFLF